ncbi:hypothetical protein [Protofrankia symbiont of Coriaria ruscifolia]|uniref:hypothetical protein n=1 Tax=Protofrankia symbiont of Coriaria ruscifolia TaxID=1306542 RepID=UPI001040E713|nr:hypothetical protein [Protofrankia symbiont of Coriaria ruscifolia]
MTLTNYYTLLALELATLALLVLPPVAQLFQIIREGEQETEDAKRRIAARALAPANLPALPDIGPDPEELT